MADVLVRHGRNPGKVVRFSINIIQVHDITHDPTEVPKQDYPRLEGDVIWILEVGTYEPDINGDPIPIRKVNLVSLSTLDSVIQQTIQDMCALIDWGIAQEDKRAPYVYWHLPNDGTAVDGISSTISGVKLHSEIYFKLKDNLPSTGIDMSSIEMTITISGTDPTKVWPTFSDISSEAEITGTPYDVQVYWSPPAWIKEEY